MPLTNLVAFNLEFGTCPYQWKYQKSSNGPIRTSHTSPESGVFLKTWACDFTTLTPLIQISNPFAGPPISLSKNEMSTPKWGQLPLLVLMLLYILTCFVGYIPCQFRTLFTPLGAFENNFAIVVQSSQLNKFLMWGNLKSVVTSKKQCEIDFGTTLTLSFHKA